MGKKLTMRIWYWDPEVYVWERHRITWFSPLGMWSHTLRRYAISYLHLSFTSFSAAAIINLCCAEKSLLHHCLSYIIFKNYDLGMIILWFWFDVELYGAKNKEKKRKGGNQKEKDVKELDPCQINATWRARCYCFYSR